VIYTEILPSRSFSILQRNENSEVHVPHVSTVIPSPRSTPSKAAGRRLFELLSGLVDSTDDLSSMRAPRYVQETDVCFLHPFTRTYVRQETFEVAAGMSGQWAGSHTHVRWWGVSTSGLGESLEEKQ